MTIGRYYDWLSWFQRVTSWTGRGGGYRSHTVHRLLASDSPAVDSADVVHERILAALGSLTAPRVIDAGCGFGGTVFYLHERLGGRYDGITLSAKQAARAGREVRRRGVQRDCRFLVRSFDDDLTAVAPEGADVITAIESLAHAPEPTRTIANLARTLRPGGRLVIVDDMPDARLADDDRDFAAFRSGWQCPAIARRATLANALAAAGLRVEMDSDLTPLVILREQRQLERLVRANRRLSPLLKWSGAGQLIRSLHGGLMLERLYRRGVMQYRLVVARRTESSG